MVTETGYGFVLSDPTTKRQFNEPKVAFNVTEVRDYEKVYAYISKEPGRLTYMVVCNPISLFPQPRVYYLDTEGSLNENNGLCSWLSTSGWDLADHIEATLRSDYKKEDRVVHWHKKGRSLLLGFRSFRNEKSMIAEYTTRDRKTGQNLCLIDWKGDYKTGRIEVWYGQKVKRKEVRVFRFPINYDNK